MPAKKLSDRSGPVASVLPVLDFSHTVERPLKNTLKPFLLIRVVVICMVCVATVCSLPQQAMSQTPANEKTPPIRHSTFVPKGLKLTFNDEFEGEPLNLEKWNYRQLGERDGALLVKETVKLDGKGNLVLAADSAEGRIRCSMISTEKSFLQKFGYFEARIQFQRQKGLHGAFWLQSPTFGKVKDDLTASGVEIDIVEFFGAGKPGNISANLHWNGYGKDQQCLSGKADAVVARVKRNGAPREVKAPDMCDAFHIYAMEWTEKGYRFAIDGIEFFKTSKAISLRDQYVVLSLLSSSWERKDLDVTKLPDSMTIDYVRVYAK